MTEEQQISTDLLIATEEAPLHPLLIYLGKILFAVLPLAGIVIGAVYSGQCPRQPRLPLYLALLGAAGLALLLLSCAPRGDGGGPPSALARLARRLRAALRLFLCAWVLAGSAWVFPAYPPDYEGRGRAGFCQRTLFLAAFGATAALLAALAAAALLALAIRAAAALRRALPPPRPGLAPGPAAASSPGDR